MYGNKFVKIGLAPPRHVLKMFGGYMNFVFNKVSKRLTIDQVETIYYTDIVLLLQ